MNTYVPNPISTSGVALPEELDGLVEQLSEHNHDHWAMQRIADGWVWGYERSDRSKTHPGLVPYDDLPEGEKEYDRISVLETLRAIIKLGYEIH